MKILVTGATGYIGQNICCYLDCFDNTRIFGLDINESAKFKGEKFFKLDITNKPALKKILYAEKFDYVIHLAGIVNPKIASEQPLACFQANVLNSLSLIKLCLELNINKFIFASSAAVYGNQRTRQLTEDAPRSALNIYGRSKILCEDALMLATAINTNFKFAILRHFFVVGTGFNNSPTHKETHHPIKLAVNAALGLSEKMLIFGNQYNTIDGSCVRDFLHMKDLQTLVQSTVDYLKTGDSIILNGASGNPISLLQITDKVKQIHQQKFQVEIQDGRENEYVSLVADISRAKQSLNWIPEYSNLEMLCQSVYDDQKYLMK